MRRPDDEAKGREATPDPEPNMKRIRQRSNKMGRDRANKADG